MFNKLRMFVVVALAVSAIAFTAGSSSAAGMRWGGNVFGAFNTFSMKDWNDIIDASNASSGSNFDNITSGYSFGLGPFVVIDDKWEVGAHYEMLTGKKSEDQGVSVEPKANSFGLSVDYLVPSQGAMSFSLGLSGDYYTLSGELDDPVTTNKTKGSGIGGQIRGTGSYAFAPEFAGFVSAGYRMADIDIDTIGGQDVSASGLKTEDYSGLVLRVGISLMQSKAK
jgi:hypothetical protein